MAEDPVFDTLSEMRRIRAEALALDEKLQKVEGKTLEAKTLLVKMATSKSEPGKVEDLGPLRSVVQDSEEERELQRQIQELNHEYEQLQLALLGDQEKPDKIGFSHYGPDHRLRNPPR